MFGPVANTMDRSDFLVAVNTNGGSARVKMVSEMAKIAKEYVIVLK